MRLHRGDVVAPSAGRGAGWPARFVALTLIWGASFLFIKVGLEALAPLQIALGRTALGAGAVLAALALRRERLPRGARLWGHLAAAALLLNAAPFTLFAYAEQRIPSALAGVCNATTPLFTLLAAMLALPDERPTRGRVAGLGLGFVGVLVVFAPWRGAAGGHDPVGAGFALAAAACYGVGWAYLRRFLSGSGHSSLALSAAQLLVGALELAAVAPFATAAPAHVPARVALAVVALGALGTGAAYVLQYGLIRDAGATAASTVSYFVPLVSIAIGAAALGETLAWSAPVGAAAIVAGAFVSRRAAGAPASRGTAGAPAAESPPSRPPRAPARPAPAPPRTPPPPALAVGCRKVRPAGR